MPSDIDLLFISTSILVIWLKKPNDIHQKWGTSHDALLANKKLVI